MKFKYVKALFIATMGIFLLGGVDVTASQEVHMPAIYAEAEEASDTQVKSDTRVKDTDATEETEKENSKKNNKNKKKNKKNKKKKNNKKNKHKKAETPELVITPVTNYLNIRNAPNLEGEVIGKLYRHSVGTLLEECEDGWYKIESGTVTGYVKSEYVLRGEEGEALAQEVGQRLAEIDTTTLRIRKEPSTDSATIGLLADGEILNVQEEVEGWAKIGRGETEGYISVDYAKVYTENNVAESKEEEERRLANEAAAQEAARQQALANQREAASSGGQAASSGQSSTPVANNANQSAVSNKPSGNGTSNQNGSASKNATSSGTSLGSRIANYALQFVGNPYVYGGTSLTNGADCSGFVMSVYQNFGISLPRTSGEQRYSGWDVGGLSNAKEGDLVCYPGHIGIYIGNGKIVHASTEATGIKVSNANYRSISSVRRIV